MITNNNWSLTITLIVVSLFLIGALAPDSVVERRRQMESNNSLMAEGLNKAIKERNFAEIQEKCSTILENMDKVLDFFPQGSLSANSRAKVDIWQRWGEFTKHPAKVREAAQELAAAAKAGDEEGVKIKFKALGEACKGCHASFRAPKPKKGDEYR